MQKCTLTAKSVAKVADTYTNAKNEKVLYIQKW